MEILIKRLNDNARLPAYGREAGPGIDLYALDDVTIEPGERVLVQTGVALAMPVGYIGLIWSQRGMTTQNAMKVTTDIVDSGYREEVRVELTNTGSEQIHFAAGEPIAQLLVQQAQHAHLIEAEDLGGDTEK
ncbi:dUTP diphosphatase [Candidatus Kaiserbacteria bacterium]|nr:dUTP diphosphatase [Candidatus Kaiserbacteria bacterium]MCB9812504.1 dUTP diphosphatase [Candidatus Nomurabacteria bacterium]